jgi:4-amino-4-deoxy-L-arabinose transferase-like glycosyltransferase
VFDCNSRLKLDTIRAMKQRFMIGLGLLTGLYFLTRLVNLTLLPVFADEAIYIRWAQLMNQDFTRWVFYPLQDGKPPLHMIIVAQFLPWFTEPLFASRLVSVVFGSINVILLYRLTRILGGGTFAGFLAALLYIILPFSLFHDRMGLIDTMFVTWLIVSFIGFLQLTYSSQKRWILLAATGYGLALCTKTPALFFMPVYMLLYIVQIRLKKTGIPAKSLLVRFFAAGILGFLLFLVLKTSPVFPSLFSRSSDFTVSPGQLIAGEWQQIPINLEKTGRWLATYLTGGVLAVLALGMVVGAKESKRNYWMLLLGLVFLLPFILFARVYASRYIFPVVLFILPLTALVLEHWWREDRRRLAVMALVLIGVQSTWFGAPLITKPEMTPFVREDVEQYLTSWSAGYGIPQVRDFISEKAKTGKIVVATEGFFGTLPDGLLMYFDLSPLIANIEIFGVGQPIRGLDEQVQALANTTETYLLVNEHRLEFDTSVCCQIVAAYERPRQGPALLLLRVLPL